MCVFFVLLDAIVNATVGKNLSASAEKRDFDVGTSGMAGEFWEAHGYQVLSPRWYRLIPTE